MKKEHAGIILKPIINEKSTLLAATGKYTFAVSQDANKLEIASAFKELMTALYPKNKCQVTAVNTLAVRGRIRRSKRHGRAPRDTKKAIITVTGDQLEMFSA
jgi:large subunit ribosomal protein L23